MKHSVTTGLILGLTMLLCPPADAVTEMPLSTHSNGSGRVGDTTYTMFCTVGQPAIGITGPGSGSYVCESGFWHPLQGYVSDTPEFLDGDIPVQFELGFASPNPIGSVSTILYAVPKPAHVSIRLFDITGREVQILVDGPVSPGYPYSAKTP